MATVNDLIRAAIATSRHNVRDETASDAELIALIGDLLEGYVDEGARANRRFFGARFSVPFDSDVGGWRRPGDVTMVVRLEAGAGMVTAGSTVIAAGTEIVEIPLEQRDTEPGRPAVYSWGQFWYPAGRTPDPVSGELIVFGSRRAIRPVTVDDPIDPLWPQGHLALLKWDLAIYLAAKDGDRESEVAIFTALRDREYERYLAFLRAESITETRDYGHGTPFPAPRVTPR